MRYDVPLIGREGHDPSILPDLLGVFRAAQKQGPLPLSKQAYFNSWILSGIFHHKDTNTHLTLRQRPKIVRVAYETMQYAINAECFFDTETMDRRSLTNLVDRQARLIGFFKRRLGDAALPIDKNILTLAQTGEMFNDFITRERDAFYQRRDEQHDSKKKGDFAHGIAPFIPAYFAAHMMHLIGERLRDNRASERNAFMFRVFLPEVRETIPFGDNTIHDIGEGVTYGAVNILRTINLRLQEVLRAADDGSYLPRNAAIERRLIEELFMFTKPYREPNLMPAHTADAPATVLSLDAFRAKKSAALQHHPA